MNVAWWCGDVRVGLVVVSVLLAGCSSDAGDDDADAAGTGSSSQPAGGSGASGAGASVAGGSAGMSNAMAGSAAGSAGTTAGAGTMGMVGADAGTTAGEFANVGVCGQRGEGTVSETAFEGFEEFYIIGDEGFGDDICVVRFDAKRVGEAPEGCDDPAGDIDCLWTHMVELSNPSVVTDVDGVCAHSELALDDARIAELDGSHAAYGFVSEFAGHNSVLMKYDEMLGAWDAYGNASWIDDTGAFHFDRRDGICNY